MARTTIVPQERILGVIHVIRGQKVILDSDMAQMYGVETRVLVQAVKRNLARFPPDFLFQLTADELELLRSQTVISSSWGGRRGRPYAFTEQGVAMLSGVLRSGKAAAVHIEIIRAFVRLREMLAAHRDLMGKLESLEQKYDEQFRVVFDAIRSLMIAEEKPPKEIGFTAKKK